MKRHRIAEDGSLIFPRRGSPPELLEGYYRDSGDEYVLKPIIEECGNRTYKEVRSRCCKTRRPYCLIKDRFVKMAECKECQSQS